MGKKKKKGKQKGEDGSSAAQLRDVSDPSQTKRSRVTDRTSEKGKGKRHPVPASGEGPAAPAKEPKEARKKTRGERFDATVPAVDLIAAAAVSADRFAATAIPVEEAVASDPPDDPPRLGLDVTPRERSEQTRSRSDDLTEAIRDALRMRPGWQLAEIDPGGTPAFGGTKKDAEAVMADRADEFADWQERLYAEAKSGGSRSLLLIVQGMDTSGKGGIMRHVVGLMDPQGVDITAFKAPTREERSHPFLWRIRRALPGPGMIGVFDRSQYEDVLVVRVRNLVPSSTWSRRYGQINTFERTTARQGTSIVKVMLHISSEEQKARLGERLERPDKYWKFNPGDIDDRAHWEDYQVAYQTVLERTHTDHAPWYVVPANEKWYARLAVQHILLGELRAMNPQWPEAAFDVAEQKARLAAT